MNNSGDAAEQVVRLSLEGTEVTLRLAGCAAKNICQALADFEAMKKSISEYQYKNTKALLEAKLE